MAARALSAWRKAEPFRWKRLSGHISVVAGLLLFFTGCSSLSTTTRTIEVTAYCDCGDCNGYTTGSWPLLKLDRWNKRINYGSDKGKPYTGKTASGGTLQEPNAGLLSADTVKHPWMAPVRILPWKSLPSKGTIAADTSHYPFGTEMYVPGWGWGVVGDRGGDIKGPDRIDIFFSSHRETLDWGRQTLPVKVRITKRAD